MTKWSTGSQMVEEVLKEGDIVALDLGLVHDGIIVDSAVLGRGGEG